MRELLRKRKPHATAKNLKRKADPLRGPAETLTMTGIDAWMFLSHNHPGILTYHLKEKEMTPSITAPTLVRKIVFSHFIPPLLTEGPFNKIPPVNQLPVETVRLHDVLVRPGAFNTVEVCMTFAQYREYCACQTYPRDPNKKTRWGTWGITTGPVHAPWVVTVRSNVISLLEFPLLLAAATAN